METPASAFAYRYDDLSPLLVGIPGGRANSERVSGAEEDWGVVVPLRRSQPERGSSPLGPISPELVLVDPVLARAARALLPDLPRFVPSPLQPAQPIAERVLSSIEPAVAEPVSSSGRRPGFITGIAVGLGAAALVGLLVRSDERPTPQQVETVASPAPTVPTTTAKPTTPSATTPAPSPTPSPGTTTAAPSTTTGSPTPTDAPPPGQTFVWANEPNAAAYEFQLFRGSERIFRASVTEPRLELPGRWRRAGRSYELTPGSYRWYVWPVSRQTGRQAAVATVQARLVVEEGTR